MALQLPKPPADLTEAVRSTVQSLRSTGESSTEDASFRSAGIRASSSDNLELTSPHEVFNIGLDDLVRDASLTAAQPVGWRYLVSEGGTVIASAETTGGGGQQDQVFSQFSQGPFAAATAQALATVRASDHVRDVDVEARVLRIPALHFMAVWLHAAGGDTLVPLAPAPPGIEADRSYPASELLSTLAAHAQDIDIGSPDDRTGG
jgi:hypothetical protein